MGVPASKFSRAPVSWSPRAPALSPEPRALRIPSRPRNPAIPAPSPRPPSTSPISCPGSRTGQISARRKDLRLDTALCWKEPLEARMAEQEQQSCLHTPVWGVEGFLTTTSTEVEQPTTTGKRPIRGFNILSEHSEHSTSTINFEDILAEEPLDHTDDTSPISCPESRTGQEPRRRMKVEHLTEEEKY